MPRLWIPPLAQQANMNVLAATRNGALIDTTQGAQLVTADQAAELAKDFPTSELVAITNYEAAIAGVPGLVAYLPLNDPAGSGTAHGALGAYPGTPAGSWTFGNPGLLGQIGDTSGNTPGSSSKVTLGGTAAPDLGFAGKAPFSVEAWFMRNGGLPGSTVYIVAALNGLTAGAAGGWRLVVNSGGQVVFGRFAVDSNDDSVQSAVTITGTGDVHHAVGTYDGASMSIYVDGVLRGTIQSGRSVPALTVAPAIGAVNYTNAASFSGNIGHVAIYNRPLTAKEAFAHYTLGKLVE